MTLLPDDLVTADPEEMPFALSAAAATGTADDEDDPSGESESENEVPVGKIEEGTETPEELEIDEEDDLAHPEDDDADLDDDELDDDDLDDDELDDDELEDDDSDAATEHDKS